MQPVSKDLQSSTVIQNSPVSSLKETHSSQSDADQVMEEPTQEEQRANDMCNEIRLQIKLFEETLRKEQLRFQESFSSHLAEVKEKNEKQLTYWQQVLEKSPNNPEEQKKSEQAAVIVNSLKLSINNIANFQLDMNSTD